MNEFELLVNQMRVAQREYFKSRKKYWLEKSKKLEAVVDIHLKKKNMPTLFEGEVIGCPFDENLYKK